MMPESRIGTFCRLYSILLYAYPSDFRREFGRPMQQLFRDRCRDLARSPGRLPLVHFALQTIADWCRTTIRERASAIWSAGRPHSRRSSVTEWAVTLLLYLFVTTTLVQAYVVPTGSMESNLLIGDHMLVDRLAYSDPGPLGRHILPYRDVNRGDIIAFLYPEDIRQTYVKRVIGIPGDRIHLESGRVVRNGCLLDEPYTQHIATFTDPYRDNFPTSPGISTTPRGREMFLRNVRDGEVTVPPGMIFAMGDNRENSADSRYWGFVPREYVVGKPLVVYWSYDAPTADLQEWTVDHAIDLAEHFFTRTRWNRTLFVPRSQPAREIGGVR
jgi:signal peptidase I